jgi:septum formation topological specificity factor MinE
VALENEVSIKLRLDTSELRVPEAQAGTMVPRQSRAPASDARVERATARAVLVSQRNDDIERLESRLNRKLTRWGVRAGAALAIGELSEVTDLNNNFVTRIGTAAVAGGAFGGPIGAAISTMMATMGELITAQKSHEEALRKMRSDVLAIIQRFDDYKQQQAEKQMKYNEQFEKKLAEIKKKSTEEADELNYQTGQYIQ